MAGTSSKQELATRMLDDLDKLMWAMSWDLANDQRWMLEVEEIHAELCLELVKIVNNPRYQGKEYIDMKRIAVVSMRNRVRDLASVCYGTHRKAEARSVSLDAATDGDGSDGAEENEERTYSDSVFSYNDAVGSQYFDFDMKEFLIILSEDARQLVCEVMNPTERTIFFLRLSIARKKHVHPKGLWTVTLTPVIMGRSLGWSKNRVEAAWKEVKIALNGASCFDSGLVVQGSQK